MVWLKPFRGILYSPQVVGDLQKVVSPPYDLITPELQAQLYQRSPYNAVRLELSQGPQRYAASARTFRQWVERGVLVQDPQPAFYFYRQEFSLEGKKRVRRGVMAAMRLEDPSGGKVRPHEHTLEWAKEDRLALLRSCPVNFSPIFALYSKPQGPSLQEVEKDLDSAPLIHIQDEGGVVHSFWRIGRREILEGWVCGLSEEAVLIADGHHRYEAALSYCRERQAQAPPTGEEPFHYVLTYLTHAREEGLCILPTHRLLREVHLPKAQDLQKVLRRDFGLTLFPKNRPDAFFAALKTQSSRRKIGCALAGAEHLWLLSFDEKKRSGLVDPAPRLDVHVLHKVLLEQTLGLPPTLQKQKLTYTLAQEEALREVWEGKYQAAFFLNPPTFEEIEAVCASGRTLPEKSTYFFPKLLTGLVFYPLYGGP